MNRLRLHIHYNFLTVLFLAHSAVSSIVLRLHLFLSYSYLFLMSELSLYTGNSSIPESLPDTRPVHSKP